MHDQKVGKSFVIYDFVRGGYIERRLKAFRDAGIKIPMTVDIVLKDGTKISEIAITNDTSVELPEQYNDFSEHNIQAIIVCQSMLIKRQFNVRTGECVSEEAIDPRLR